MNDTCISARSEKKTEADENDEHIDANKDRVQSLVPGRLVADICGAHAEPGDTPVDKSEKGIKYSSDNGQHCTYFVSFLHGGRTRA